MPQHLDADIRQRQRHRRDMQGLGDSAEGHRALGEHRHQVRARDDPRRQHELVHREPDPAGQTLFRQDPIDHPRGFAARGDEQVRGSAQLLRGQAPVR